MPDPKIKAPSSAAASAAPPRGKPAPDPAIQVQQSPLSTRRLNLEPLSSSHVPGLFTALHHPDVNRYLSTPEVTTFESFRTRIERLAAGPPPARSSERWHNFAIKLRVDNTIIGRIEATSYGSWGEIAYMLGPRWWGGGYASEGTRWLIHHLSQRGVSELWAAVQPGNVASKRVLTRTGFAPSERRRPLGSYDPGDETFVRRG